MTKPRKDETAYSVKVPGAKGNYNWAVRFDYTDGYVGIDQWGNKYDRVLLSPYQVQEFLAWLKSMGVK